MRSLHRRSSLVIALAWRLLATWLLALRTDERSKSRDKACFGYALREGGSPKGNSDGNTNVRFHQKDTQKRFFERFEQNRLTINRFRADCGSCSEEIVEEIEKHCKSFYIRANRCSSLYNDIFALRGWEAEEINGIEFELNSILVEKWKGKAYRLVIQRQKRTDGVQDLWEGEYTYRCILTNDYESSVREIAEFYNLRGGKERFR